MVIPGASRSYRARALPWAIGLLILAGFGGCWWQRYGWLPKRFHVVEPGAVYRCGALTPAQLARLQQRYGIRTVLSLLNPAARESRLEKAAAARLGVRYLNVPLPGDGSSTPEQRARIRAIMLDRSLRPILVHCAAGVNRTGLAVGIYRLHVDGWTLEQVLDEMRRIGFEDLPRHENLRQALAAEARLARRRKTAPATTRASVP